MSSYTLYLGDCLEVMPGIPNGSIDAIIADWPYGVTNCKWDSVIPLEPLWKECKRVIKPRGAIVLTASQPFTSVLVMSNINWFRDEWIWEKDKASNFMQAKRQPLKYHESVIVFCEGSPTYNPQKWDKGTIPNRGGSASKIKPGGAYNALKERDDYLLDTTSRYPSTIQLFYTCKHNDEENGSLHPTQKPVALMEYLIKTYTNPGDLVLDNTMGSGSTGEACLRTGRRFIGIEKDPGYFEIAQARLKRVGVSV